MKIGLWQAPRLRINEENEEERKATWLELFYDLIFVVAIAELSHSLSKDVSVQGFVGFVALFIPVWFCWLGATFYATLFDTDDIRDRLLTLLQMMIVAALAVNVHHGLSTSSTGFALSYVAVRCILIFQFLFAGYHIKEARPLTNWYAVGFSISAGLWLISIFAPVPFRFLLWASGLILDFLIPLGTGDLATKIPPDISHVPERLGLFTIIVLGESIVAVVRGVAEQEWNFSSTLIALLGLSIAFSFWWLYFDSVSGSVLENMKTGRIGIVLCWLYSHVVLAIALAATGVGVEHMISKSAENILIEAERWLFCGSVTLCLSTLALTNFITCILEKNQKARILSIYRLCAGAFVLALAISGMYISPIVLSSLVAMACILTVVLDLTRKHESKN
ncbi:MAG: low temperature requirement protein A [Nostocales cyanobacterium 94392]|nr:low temperature requirement protein A [Nostocales cyanobacterium 94392]